MSDVQDRLLQSAAEVFAERGYEGAGVAEIARRAGLTTGAIYSRYTGKGELLLAAFDAAIPTHVRGILERRDEDLPSTEAVAALGSRLFDPADRQAHEILLEAIVAGRRDPDLAQRVQARLEADRLRLVDYVEDGKNAGLVDPSISTDAIVAACQAIGLGIMVMIPFQYPLPRVEDWDAVIARLIGAFTPQSPATGG